MPGSARTTRNIDWNEYEDTFPAKYVNYSQFSDKLMEDAIGSKVANAGHPISGLDVGGGLLGTRYLVKWTKSYSLLDPFVESHLPQICWSDLEARTFDVVLARGSINYLTQYCIKQLADAVQEDGLFLFNTFIQPPSEQMERLYHTKTSSFGSERARMVTGGPFGSVEHTLYPNEKDYCIVHTFYYYPLSFLRELLEESGLKCDLYKDKNTAVFICRR